jgi:hypothetical protein
VKGTITNTANTANNKTFFIFSPPQIFVAVAPEILPRACMTPTGQPLFLLPPGLAREVLPAWFWVNHPLKKTADFLYHYPRLPYCFLAKHSEA